MSFKIVSSSSPCSDCTCEYRIMLEDDVNLDDVISQILRLYDNYNSWGTISIIDTDKTYTLDYEHGHILESCALTLNEIAPISFNPVFAMTGSGGWNRNDFEIYMSEEAINKSGIKCKKVYFKW